ncbi:MAG: ABC transporter ATP-binding protein [Desulfurococcaceae archaeon]
MDELLSLDGIEAGYGEFRVLHGVNLEVRRGEVVALVGPNGAGKTTLLKTVMGLTTLHGGRVKFEGRDITRLSPDKRVRLGIVLVPEGRGLFPNLTVKENLLLGAFTVKSEREIARRLEFVYSLFPRLKEREGQRAGSLSGGEAQMLAIGRALMGSPKLLLLDEPSLGLAPKIVQEIFGVIRRLHEEQGISMLLVEQHVKESLEISDRGYVIEGGKIVASGPSKELMELEALRKIYLAR